MCGIWQFHLRNYEFMLSTWLIANGKINSDHLPPIKPHHLEEIHAKYMNAYLSLLQFQMVIWFLFTKQIISMWMLNIRNVWWKYLVYRKLIYCMHSSVEWICFKSNVFHKGSFFIYNLLKKLYFRFDNIINLVARINMEFRVKMSYRNIWSKNITIRTFSFSTEHCCITFLLVNPKIRLTCNKIIFR